MTMILMAFGLVLIVEGLVYALAPSLVERMLEMLRTLPDAARRQVGILSMVLGLILVWSAYQLGFG
ncbi:DUF2065 domain-containing protein [Ruegeria sp. 2012CJ41-6]|uniref:DUF2065 domain-containing protein n=1 Tax=Ruegeria spongiae TaxID=2942209 RepID=A0ABT0Q3E7_9RHOB|nr:DUF2065 domain-containing protein [Ruegeria spongiae]MCL6284401.1 DUF2065 domain-containing protein [Ruegeria spongiae]